MPSTPSNAVDVNAAEKTLVRQNRLRATRGKGPSAGPLA